jgi:putative peptide zinc metalloprotease protein
MKLTKLSSLTLVSHIIRRDKKNYIVEDLDSGDFYEMPLPAIDAIGKINQGLTLESIQVELEALYPDEDIDILDFAHQLIELELVSKIDGQDVIQHREKSLASQGFLWVPPILGKLFFNKICYAIYALLFFLNIVLFIKFPELFPSYTDYFVFEWMSLDILLWMGIGTVLLVIHELGHILSVRSKGLPAKLSLSHRLVFIVLETDLTAAWKIPSRSRNVLYLGGLALDMVILAAALAVQIIFPEGSGLLISIAKIVVIDIFIRFVFQCGIYMKTDLYYVFENVTGSYNLMENAHYLLKNMLGKNERNVGEVSYKEEMRTIAAYSIIYFLGVFLTIAIFVFYSLPQMAHVMGESIQRLNSPFLSKPFIDGILIILETAIGAGLLVFSWSRKFTRPRKQPLDRSAF